MPIVDMPIEEMQTYMGVNPKPADYDEFWDKSLAEMRATDPETELIPSDFTCPFADCFDLYFTGTFNSRIHAKFLRPKNLKEPAPAVLEFHGYGGGNEEWTNFLGYAAAGFVVAALDCRGQEGPSEDMCPVSGNTLNGFITRGLSENPEKMYYRNQFLDTAMLARIVMDMPEVDENRVGAYGGSQGGGLTVACAALEPRIKYAVPIFPFLSDYKRTWDMDLDINAYADMRAFFRRCDPFHEKETEYFTKLGYTDIQFLAPRIRAEVLMLTALMDDIVPPSTQFAMYNKIKSKKEVRIYPDFGHEGLPHSSEITYEFFMEKLLK